MERDEDLYFDFGDIFEQKHKLDAEFFEMFNLKKEDLRKRNLLSESSNVQKRILNVELEDLQFLYSDVSECHILLSQITRKFMERYILESKNNSAPEIDDYYKTFLVASARLSVMLIKQVPFYEDRIEQIEKELVEIKVTEETESKSTQIIKKKEKESDQVIPEKDQEK